MNQKIQHWLSKTVLLALIFQLIGASLFLSVPKAQAAALPDIIINEISPHTSPEWVELKNTTNEPVTLFGWTIEDSATNLFGTINTSIPANGYLVIEKAGTVLNNDDDSVILKDIEESIVDQKSYTSFSPVLSNISLSRIPEVSVDWLKTRSTKGVTNNGNLPVPALLSPTNNLFTNNNDITFSWNDVVDPENDTVAYDLNYGKIGEVPTEIIDAFSPKTIPNLEVGEYVWTIKARDDKGATATSASYTFTIDIAAPLAISDIKGSATLEGNVTLDWSNYNESNDEISKYNIYFNGTKIDETTGDETLNKLWSPDLPITETTIYEVSAVDAAGNESDKSSITVELGKVYFDGEDVLPDEVPDVIPVANNLKVGVIGVSDYGIVTKPEQPAHLLPDDIKKKVVGSYWTFEYLGEDNNGGIIQIYFTKEDLEASHITDPSTQLQLYYYNELSGQWEKYVTEVVGEDKEKYFSPSDMQGFVGYLRAEVGHFTEFAVVADKFVPAAPENVVVKYANGKLKISWDRVEGATGYRVFIGTSPTNWIKEIEVQGENNTQIEESVQSGKTYFVKIIAIGFDSLLSPTSEIVFLAVAGAEPEVVYAEVPVEEPPTSPSPTVFSDFVPDEVIAPPAIPDEGEVKSEESEESSTNRVLITVIILILAAGAGIGGYYGYLWWQDRNQEETAAPVSPAKKSTPVKSKTKNKSSTKRTSRW